MATNTTELIVLDEWFAHPDCRNCGARETALKEIGAQYEGRALNVAQAAIGFCEQGTQPAAGGLCARNCSVGTAAFLSAAQKAVASFEQPRDRAPVLVEEEK